MTRALPSGALALTSALVVGACGGATGAGEPPGPESSFARATTLLEAGRFEEAAVALREVASRCESGEHGRHSLLLLAVLNLDPRNSRADPDSAALMAARYLYLPDAPEHERPLGNMLYVLALDGGGNPGLRPGPADVEEPRGLARRFSNCGEPVVEGTVSLPVLSEGVSAKELEAQRDAARVRAEDLAGQTAELRARVTELEAELERIRRLLRTRPDTAGGPPTSPRR